MSTLKIEEKLESLVLNNIENIREWISNLLLDSDFCLEEIDLNRSTEWDLVEGRIAHKTGSFFSIIGLKWIDENGKDNEQAFIDQQEIGTLGFLLFKEKGIKKILVQAKIEPGNIGVIQLAPSVQVTKSNANRVHGGEIALYIEYFNSGDNRIVYDKLHSEQGNRFYFKQNRNALSICNEQFETNNWYKWINIEIILNCIQENFLFNTDFRSVLVSIPWTEIVDRIPFSKNTEGFGLELFKSYNHSSKKVIDNLKHEIIKLRTDSKQQKVVFIESIKDFNKKDNIISITNSKFSVQQFRVKTKGREVAKWDQPIINSKDIGNIILICGRINGILHFNFKTCNEPGLINKVELTATLIVEPGNNNIEKNIQKGELIVDCLQSEEGGRFFQDINHFQIIDIGVVKNLNNNDYWLTLKDIRNLLNEQGWFTNEARSILSLLLKWL